MTDPFNAFLDRAEPPIGHADNGPLAGLTMAVKDIFDVEGQRGGGGNPSKLDEARPAEATAPAVKVLLDAGARYAGRTQTDELTFSLMGQNAHFPQPVNPAAPERVTGGSSSGSAAAVAGGLVDIALGSDTGGSVRAPASFCGLIGLRTTHGAIPLQGAMPLAPSFDTFGWFARDIDIYEKVAEVLLGTLPSPMWGGSAGEAGRGGGDVAPNLSNPPTPDLRSDPPHKGEGKAVRLAALDSLLLGDREATEYGRMAAIAAEVLGAPREVPALSYSIDDLYWTFRKLQGYEAWAMHGAWISEADRGLGPGVRERFEFGSTLGCEVASDETKKRNAFRQELADLLGDDGILVMPTVPGAAPLKDASFDDLQAYRERALRLLCLSGLSGFPQITLPLGKVDGAPFGISLLGPAGSDLALIRLGRHLLEAVKA